MAIRTTRAEGPVTSATTSRSAPARVAETALPSPAPVLGEEARQARTGLGVDAGTVATFAQARANAHAAPAGGGLLGLLEVNKREEPGDRVDRLLGREDSPSRWRGLAEVEPRRRDDDTVELTRVEGPLFVDGAQPQDVRQGANGDCYFLSALAAVAQTRPQLLREAIRDHGDGTYTVRFYDHGRPHEVTVDNQLYTRDGKLLYAQSTARDGQGRPELWPAIFEKAYARWKGGYEALSDGGLASRALEALTGRPASRELCLIRSNRRIFDRVDALLEQGRPVAAATYSIGSAWTERIGLRPGHAYAVLGTQREGEQGYVILGNPQGRNEVHGRAYEADLDRDGDGVLDGDDGVFRIRADDFGRYFETVYVGG